MTINLSTLPFLASPSGESLLTRLADEDLSDANSLRLLTRLRKDHSPENAGAVLELARLRKSAEAKFGDDAQKLFFTREALEQASDPLIRRYRSTFVNGLRVLDVCCSIGSDALAFARSGADVLGLDIDPLRIEMARLNAAALSITNVYFEVRDARAPLPDADFVFFDPARRDSEGKRIFDVEQYQPPLSIIKAWGVAQVCVKLSPGVAIAQLDGYVGWLDFISVDGELKEALLQIGQPMNGTLPHRSLSQNRSNGCLNPTPQLSEPGWWRMLPSNMTDFCWTRPSPTLQAALRHSISKTQLTCAHGVSSIGCPSI
jgi:SAM-dependent methyltransferase